MIEQALCPVMIGRDAELADLEDALLAARRGEGSVVALTGDAGMGKTRLASELRRQAAKLGCAVLWGACSEADVSLPYLPFLEAIGNYLGSVDASALGARLGPASNALAQLFPQLGNSAAAAETTDSSQGKQRLFESVVSLIAEVARESGLMLVLEDVHWADSSTRELLDYLTRRVGGTRSLVLVTYRRDDLHRRHPLLPIIQGWRRSGMARVVELDALPAAELSRMVGAILAVDGVSVEFQDLLTERTEGNPFVLEEMLKDAIDRGDIYRTDTGWDRKEIRDLKLPRSVVDSILMRVERLPPGHADVLRSAAVLGRTFNYAHLVTLLGGAESEVVEALEAATRQQLVEEDPAGEDRYRFRHALTWEAIYSELIPPRRRALHSRAADALAAAGAAPSERLNHLLAAGRRAEAVPVGVEAAEAAERAQAPGQAAGIYQRILAEVEDPELRAQLLARTGEALWGSDDVPAAVTYLTDGIGALERAGAVARAAHYRLILGQCRWTGGEVEAARDEYQLALEALEPLGPSEDLALAYMRLSGLRSFAMDRAGGLELAQRAIDTAEAAGAEMVRAWAYNFRGIARADTVSVDAGMADILESYRLARANGYAYVAGNALHNALSVAGENLRLMEHRDLVDRLADSTGTYWWSGYGHHVWKSQVEMQELHLASAAEHSRAAVTAARQAGAGRRLSHPSRLLAMALTEMDHLDEALAATEEAGNLEEAQEWPYEVEAFVPVALARGDVEAATASAQRLLPLLDQLVPICVGMDAAVAGLVAGGRLDEACAVLEACDKFRPARPQAFLDRMRARLLLAAGDVAGAAERARASAAGFRAAGYRLSELRTRVLLADCLVAAGRQAEAIAELLSVEKAAGQAKLLVRHARERLLALGRELAEETIPVDPGGGWAAESASSQSDAVERMVTVMFADVRGYTSMTGTIAPAEMVQRLSSYQRWAVQEVTRHHGLVDKFAGDAVMATYNVTTSRLDHTLHAVRSGLALQDKAALTGLPVGVGIAVGPAVVGRLTEGANVSVIGATTNLAARLQAAAGAGEMVLSEEAYSRAGDWLVEQGFEASEEHLELKGFPGRVRAFRVRISGEEP